MSLSTNIQNITEARAYHHDKQAHLAAFDSVDVRTEGGRVSLFLPAGTGQAVADAINAAISPAMAEAAE